MKSRGSAALAWTVAAAAAVGALTMMTDIARRSGEAVEAVTPLTLGVAVTASVLAVAGASALVVNRHRDIALLSATASMLVVAVLALSVFGILVLPLVIVTVVVLARRSSGRRRIALALASGPVLVVGTAALLAIWVQPPLVECLEHGVRSTSRPWWSSGSGSGSSGGSSSGTTVSTGSIETPSGRYEYRCQGRTLTEFRRAWTEPAPSSVEGAGPGGRSEGPN